MKPVASAKLGREQFMHSWGEDNTLTRYQHEVAGIFARSPMVDHRVLPAYSLFAEQIMRQFMYMTDVLKVDVEFTDDDPSAGDTRAALLREQYLNTGTLTIFRSQGEHQILDGDGLEYKGREETCNSLFRAVHDYFGHLASGGEFGWLGETRAYFSHAAMFTEGARRALFSETVGQQCWYAVHKDYSPQKCVWFADRYLNFIPLS